VAGEPLEGAAGELVRQLTYWQDEGGAAIMLHTALSNTGNLHVWQSTAVMAVDGRDFAIYHIVMTVLPSAKHAGLCLRRGHRGRKGSSQPPVIGAGRPARPTFAKRTCEFVHDICGVLRRRLPVTRPLPVPKPTKKRRDASLHPHPHNRPPYRIDLQRGERLRPRERPVASAAQTVSGAGSSSCGSHSTSGSHSRAGSGSMDLLGLTNVRVDSRGSSARSQH
jgi:hypothetical protein